ncbi:MAG: hypothetical protein K6T30_03190 [Alicyclobacillus sp.]|nr:hypothetical protein [Alicyclobacillus sp.]
MRVYLSLGDRDAESWVIGKLAACLKRATSFNEADAAVVTRMADLKAAVERGIPVRLVAGPLDSAGQALVRAARKLGVKDVWAWPEGGEGSAAELLAFVAGVLGDAPAVRIAHGPYRLVIRSARQAGGTFLAWNLWHVLRERGIDARLLSVSSASPLASWLSPPYHHMAFGGTEADGGEVWILDASDTTAQVEGDAVVVVRDCDPAKVVPLPPGGMDAWTVCNRVPAGVQPGDPAHLVIGDLGTMAYEAMTSGVPVAVRHPALVEALWGLWQAVWNGERSFRAKVSATGAVKVTAAESVLSHTPDGDAKHTGGFDLDDTAGDDSTDGGFVLDD